MGGGSWGESQNDRYLGKSTGHSLAPASSASSGALSSSSSRCRLSAVAFHMALAPVRVERRFVGTRKDRVSSDRGCSPASSASRPCAPG